MRRGSAMLRSQLIALIRDRLRDVPSGDVELGVATILNAIERSLVSGGRVEIRGFGSFSTQKLPSRIARNPRTGLPVNVLPRRRVVFRAGQSLREAVLATAPGNRSSAS